MSTTIIPAPAKPADPTARPWHGHDNPLEALYQHFEAKFAGQVNLKAEIAALEQRLMAALAPAPKAPPPPAPPKAPDAPAATAPLAATPPAA